MKAHFFTKRDEPGLVYYRCGLCKEDRNAFSSTQPCNVMIGKQVIALVCPECVPQALREVADIVPFSFPDLDEVGNLIDI